MLYFDNVDVILNNTGIMAESASVEQTNSLTPIFSIGRKGISAQAPSGPHKTTFQVNYYLELDNEPSYEVISTIKNLINETTLSGIQIEIAGVTGYNCFLDSYSFKAVANELIKASVSFSSYVPLSGKFNKKRSDVVYNKSNSIAHGWSTYVVSTGTYESLPTYELAYNFIAAWEPIYVIGKKTPLEVKLLSANEKVSITKDKYAEVTFSGKSPFNDIIQSDLVDQEVDLMNLAFLCRTGYASGIFQLNDPCQSLLFNLSGAKVVASQFNANIDDFVRTTTEITRYF
jgi:hypothetical protein